MSHYVKTFQAIEIGDGGDGGDGRWIGHVRSALARAEGWLTKAGRTPEGAARAQRQFEKHMPELVPAFDRLAAQLDSPHARALLTMAAVRPFFSGCTQIGRNTTLLRNYDFHPEHCDGVIVSSHFLRPVIGMQEAGWGLLDGMNDAGLAVSLTFGGRFVHGPGFAMPLVLRYLLETCRTVDEAVGRLRALPVAIPQNVTLVDPHRSVTVYTGPDIPLIEAADSCAANHQHLPVEDEWERSTRTQARLTAVQTAGVGVVAMLRPPLYQDAYDQWLGTVYTAHYRPAQGRVTYHWPGESWEHSITGFTPGSRTIALGPPDSSNSH